MHSLRRIPYWAAIALLIYMPFHIFLSQSVSLLTGGLDAWKIGKDVALVVVVLFTICLVWQQRKRTKLFNWLVVLSALYLGLHLLLWWLNPDIYQKSAALGIIYNMRLPGFLLLGYGAILLNPGKFVFSPIFKIIIAVSTLVAFLGIVQYFLPKDILTHLGYGLDRGTRPAFFIDDNPALPRIMSTLREPNALGAYLILPLVALSWLALRYKAGRRRLLVIVLWILHAAAIYLTFSRSAWLGAVLALGLVIWWAQKDQITNIAKRFWPVAAAAILALFVVAFLGQNTRVFQRYIIHSNPDEQVVDLDSNDYHTLLVKQGLQGIKDRPFGHGPGTAGLASIQNPGGGHLTENYYVQIGYEIGILGLIVFVALSIWVYLRLWKRGDYIGWILCASFWAYVLINMLLHTWSNEAVAAQWWILAGLAIVGSSARAAPNPDIQ